MMALLHCAVMCREEEKEEEGRAGNSMEGIGVGHSSCVLLVRDVHTEVMIRAYKN